MSMPVVYLPAYEADVSLMLLSKRRELLTLIRCVLNLESYQRRRLWTKRQKNGVAASTMRAAADASTTQRWFQSDPNPEE